MDLFQRAAQRDRRGQPLAERMRPRDLDGFVGQRHLLDQGKMLAELAARGDLPSLILWGPPGSGKTTLSRILAGRAKAELVALSAVNVGIKEVREVVARATEQLTTYGRSTVLFLDEIHRFNKAQQDALLPHVENGTLVLIGATTENPSFEVIAALLSRCKVVRLERLSEEELCEILRRALTDRERGFATSIEIGSNQEKLLARIAAHADGDARRALTTLEVAVSLGRGQLGEEVIGQALQEKTLLHDREGEEHYNVVSAFIKSMRGSDPNAAVYWMARMIEAGEDPLFVCRRMVIFAGEDVGLADPRALQIAVSAMEATKWVGLPESVLHMTMAALYLARAPKSNTALRTWSSAREAVEKHGALPVPTELRNAPTPLLRAMGYGAGYQYPHDFEGHRVEAQYLPSAILGSRFYDPSGQGEER